MNKDNKQLAVRDHTLLMPVQAAQMKSRKDAIDEVCRALMTKDVHYTTIPGSGKQFLTKSGAEMFCTVFGLHPRFERKERPLQMFDGGHREWIVTCKLFNKDNYIGEGAGSCSTLESKYRYRIDKRVTDFEVPREYWKARDLGMLRAVAGIPHSEAVGTKKVDGKWMITAGGDKVENPDVADVWNTVLKMADKRALVAATLLTLGLSDKFSQDEDVVEALGGAITIKAVSVEQPAEQDEEVRADILADEYVLQAPKSQHKGKTLMEIHREAPDWLPKALNDARRRKAVTARDRANIQAFLDVMQQTNEMEAGGMVDELI